MMDDKDDNYDDCAEDDAHGDGENGPIDSPADVVLLLVIGLDVPTRVGGLLALLLLLPTLYAFVTVGRLGGSAAAT